MTQWSAVYYDPAGLLMWEINGIFRTREMMVVWVILLWKDTQLHLPG